MDSLRKQIVQQPQEAILFGRSIYENIAYSKPDASEEEVMRAAYLAHCEEFVNNLEEKYQTKVGERGVTLSGGERQRVRLACSILSDAPIVILDEATSSLDSESEMYIQQSIRETMSEKTMIVIAHRLSTIRHMDRIVVMGKGGIIEEGTHEQLMKNPRGLYKRLWDIQAEGFVLSRS
jgi:ATP-binding cassette subfamily B protein